LSILPTLDQLLDLQRRYPFSVALDDVLHSVGNPDGAIRRDDGDIARVQRSASISPERDASLLI
jgi:hypothetical protein